MSGAEPTLDELLAWSMDAEPELLPLLPALFADLEELGARVAEVLDVLRAGGVTLQPGSRALDLGCGKGGVPIALARELGYSVHGVDGMAPFITHAETCAAARGVAEACTFAVADVRTAVRESRGYDLVCMLALGDLLGSADETVGALRACVRPGGYILIDDAFLRAGAPPQDDLVHCFDHQTTLALLRAHGDEIVAERIIDGPETAAYYEEMTDRIVARGEELSHAHPEWAERIAEFTTRQRDEVARLTGPVVGALWLLRRVDGRRMVS